jgi:hypothetical protein
LYVRRRPSLLRVILGAAIGINWLVPTAVTAGQGCSATAPNACISQRRLEAQLGPYDVTATVLDLGRAGFRTVLTAELNRPPASVPGTPDGGGGGVSGTVVTRVFCRRDDYAFLPARAMAGVPCDTATPGNTTDPRQIARAMFDQMDMPSLRIDMNPRVGMVAVPTWFWIEGYDGDVMSLVDNLALSHQECHSEAQHDNHGMLVLDDNGVPLTHRVCKTISDTMTVEVRVWPRTFMWNFGDNREQTVQCPEIAACPGGIGMPFTDPHTPSPIAHPYTWSSLGANGDADAYTIRVGITFGAQYRFRINGSSTSGWQGLGDRDFAATANHQVQEAQAVLTRP